MKYKSRIFESLTDKVRMVADRIQGLDFLTIAQPGDLGLESERAHRSSPSGDKYLDNVLSYFDITHKDSIIDIGCGKGSAMRTIMKLPFARVDGIEVSEHIADIALMNFRRLKATSSEIFVCDASEFSDYDNYNYVYMYNPFPPIVMSVVVDALINSILRVERELIIIYNNATCHDVIVRLGVFKQIGLYPDKWGNGISVYSNCEENNSRMSASKCSLCTFQPNH